MNKKIKVAELPVFDAAEHLKDESDIAAYLTVVLEDGDATEFARAMGIAARARGMTSLAADTGLSRESLYKSLSGARAPSSDTLLKVIKALGFKLTVQPARL